jgi:hypothetical protein
MEMENENSLLSCFVSGKDPLFWEHKNPGSSMVEGGLQNYSSSCLSKHFKLSVTHVQTKSVKAALVKKNQNEQYRNN